MTLDDLFEQFTSNDVEDGDDDGDDDNYNAFDDTPRWKSDNPSIWTVFKGE